jgi:hypothetical protein
MERRETYYDENGKYKRRTIQMHRVIMNTPDGLMCDHRFGKTLDNREENAAINVKQKGVGHILSICGETVRPLVIQRQVSVKQRTTDVLTR